MASWAILYKFFKILPKEEIEQMRLTKKANLFHHVNQSDDLKELKGISDSNCEISTAE